MFFPFNLAIRDTVTTGIAGYVATNENIVDNYHRIRDIAGKVAVGITSSNRIRRISPCKHIIDYRYGITDIHGFITIGVAANISGVKKDRNLHIGPFSSISHPK